MTVDTAPCPGCGLPLTLDQEICGACRRPRDQQEIELGRERVRERAAARRALPFTIARWALALAAAALVFHQRAFILARAARLNAGFRRELEIREGENRQPGKSQAVAGPVAPDRPPSVENRPAAVSVATAAPVAADVAAAPRWNPASQWFVEGRAYDLITLLPVAEVSLTFELVGSDSKMGPTAKTDAQGRFSIVLPRLTEGKFEIRASHPDYASYTLYESDIPYASLPLAKRQELANEARDGDMTLPAISDVPAEDTDRRDVFLAPRR